jgi:hypothetical protein
MMGVTMNRCSSGMFLAIGTLAMIAGTAVAVDTPEVEPNDSKATATVANNGGLGLDSGDTISGLTTGTSTTVPGNGSADYFIVTTKARPLGIYRHTLTLTTSGTAGHAFTIRGLNQSAGVPGTTDTTVQTGSTVYPGAPTGARVIQWYGFGKQERIFVRVTGTTTTSAPYSAVLETTSVEPIAMSGSLQEGDIQVKPDAATATALDTDWWMLDSTLSAIPDFGHDDADETGCIRTMSNGSYTIAMNRYNVATNLGSPTDDTFRSGAVLDFPDAIACSSTLLTGSATMLAVETATGNEISGNSFTDTPFGINFFRFDIALPTQPTNPAGVGSFFPNALTECVGGTTLASVLVRPGLNPTSSGITVTGDLSSLGLSSTQRFFDDATNGDEVAGDGRYSFAITLNAPVTTGTFNFPFTITDAEGRSGGGTSANFVVNRCPMPNNAGCEAAADLTVGEPTPGFLLPTGATSPAPACGPHVAGNYNANWYRFIGTGNTMTVTTCDAVGFDTIVSVYCGFDGCGALTCVGSNDDAACTFGGTRSTLNFCSVDGASYYVLVRGFGTATGDYVVSANDSGVPCDATVACGQPTSPVGAGSLGGAVQNCGDQSALVRVTVVNGQLPTSTGVTVVADASGIGGSSTLALNDSGVDGDVTAGDNIYSARVLVPYTVDAGVPIPVAFTVSDAEGRTTQGSFNATISACTVIGACCLPDGCQQISRAACEGSGGSYVGNGVLCDVPPGYAVVGQGAAFEDIASVGTLLTQGDDTTAYADIGFEFNFYGSTYTGVNVCSNGFMSFSFTSTAYVNGAIPSAAVPNDAVYAIWDDFNFATRGQCYYATLGTAGIDQRFIVQWTDVPQYGGTDSNTFQAVLFQDGAIELRYGNISAFTDIDATVGTENFDGTVAVSVPASSIQSNTSLRLGNTPGGPSCTGCAPCAADYNQDGGVDGGDIASFFPDWEASASCADVNLDGGVDGGDIEAFFLVWQEGGC